MDKNSRIYVAGHRGMVGSAILRMLNKNGYDNIICRTSVELDLRDQDATAAFFEETRPEYVFLAAAKVGGILANNVYRADFIYDNMMIQSNVIHNAWKHRVKKLLFLGSSCIYPKLAPQPLREDYLLSGYLEPTNEPYAIAKIAGIKMCDAYRSQYGCNFISAMPTNLYGINDNYDPENSHVLPSLLRKFHEAAANNQKQVNVWGTGVPKREFLYSDDLAEACLFLMKHYNEDGPINVGIGEDISIKDLACLVQEITHFQGEIVWDTTKPDGTPRKLMDVSKINALGWKAKTNLKEGIQYIYSEVFMKSKVG
jgi:GDP-L-fucose synthase